MLLGELLGSDRIASFLALLGEPDDLATSAAASKLLLCDGVSVLVDMDCLERALVRDVFGSGGKGGGKGRAPLDDAVRFRYLELIVDL